MTRPPPPRLVLLGTGEKDPQLWSAGVLGREWPTADVLPVERCPRHLDAVLRRASIARGTRRHRLGWPPRATLAT
ncbi:hypothetical protein HBB16_01720 [Pseudonocardia sp. MCCB 268]|nr:hypothetical protein [Pseudonocardia cytotoxica]